MRSGSGTAKLADLCEFRNGLWKGKKPPFIHVGVIRNTNFRTDGSLDDSDIAFLDVEQKQFEKRSLQYGDLILEKSGGGPKQPVGRVVLFDKKDGLYSFSNFTSVIRVLDRSRLDFNYLHRVLYWYYISGATESMQRRSTGIRNLEFSAYKSLDIPLPPLPEQKRIVAILDEAFSGIATAVANTEKNLANARALFESYLDVVFSQRSGGWAPTVLGAAYDVRDGTHDSPKYVQSGRALVTSKNLRNGTLDLTKVNYIAEHDYLSISKRSGVNKGDVLFAMIGTIGNPVVVETEPDFAIKNVALFKVGDQRSGKFLRYYLMSSDVITRMMDDAKGTTQKFVGLGYLRQFPIKLPDPAVEQRLVEEISAIEIETTHLAQISRQKLAALSELKQSLLQKAFSGDLTAASRNEIETALA